MSEKKASLAVEIFVSVPRARGGQVLIGPLGSPEQENHSPSQPIQSNPKVTLSNGTVVVVHIAVVDDFQTLYTSTNRRGDESWGRSTGNKENQDAITMTSPSRSCFGDFGARGDRPHQQTLGRRDVMVIAS